MGFGGIGIGVQEELHHRGVVVGDGPLKVFVLLRHLGLLIVVYADGGHQQGYGDGYHKRYHIALQVRVPGLASLRAVCCFGILGRGEGQLRLLGRGIGCRVLAAQDRGCVAFLLPVSFPVFLLEGNSRLRFFLLFFLFHRGLLGWRIFLFALSLVVGGCRCLCRCLCRCGRFFFRLILRLFIEELFIVGFLLRHFLTCAEQGILRAVTVGAEGLVVEVHLAAYVAFHHMTGYLYPAHRADLLGLIDLVSAFRTFYNSHLL